MPFLYGKITKAGIRIECKRIECFDELESFDLVINCAGLGAKVLIKDDTKLIPVRGQVTRIKAPWINSVILDDSKDDGNYIIPKYKINQIL